MPQIAILSDSHDQIANLGAAVHHCNKNTIGCLVHCGDLISPFMLKELALFNHDVHLIYGNNRGDQHLISSRCATVYDNITHHGEMALFTFGGLKFCAVHYPETARPLAMQGTYDIVCCGHNHRHGVEQFSATMLINPGHLLGENDQTGFTILDCNTLSTRRVHVDNQLFTRKINVSS